MRARVTYTSGLGMGKAELPRPGSICAAQEAVELMALETDQRYTLATHRCAGAAGGFDVSHRRRRGGRDVEAFCDSSDGLSVALLEHRKALPHLVDAVSPGIVVPG